MSDSLADKAKEAVDTVAGAGTADKIEGGMKEAIGEAKQVVGEATGNEALKVEGTTDELAGKAQEVMGEIKERLADFGETAGEFIGDAVETVKENVGDLLDAVKDALDGDDKKPTPPSTPSTPA